MALEVDAFTDALTGLLNRRRFENLASGIFVKSDSSSTGVALILADIDHFKKVNDSFGHDAGDAVLIGVAQKMSTLVRSDDLVSRMGGEEFALLIPDVDRAGAAAIAECVRAGIAAADFETGSGKLSVTISLGVVHCTVPTAFFDVYREADAALYLAKAGGRNRVEFAAGPSAEHAIPKAV